MKIEVKDSQGNVVHTLHLAEGDYTFSISGAATVAEQTAKSSPTQRHEMFWAFGLSLVGAILYIGSQYFNTAHMNLEATDNLKSMIEILIGLVVSVTVGSFLSRALTHQFQVWKCTILIISTFLIYFALSQNLFGFRWILPRIFWIREVYNLTLISGIGFLVWFTIKIFLPQINLVWRKIITSTAVVFILTYSLLNYLPFRREYVFYHLDTPPPKPQVIDSAPMTVDQFIEQIQFEEQAGH